jgi:hypothetical protein
MTHALRSHLSALGAAISSFTYSIIIFYFYLKVKRLTLDCVRA